MSTTGDDADLLRCYAETGSNQAFEVLVRRHLNVIFFAALRQLDGDEHAARDVTQAVFTDLARKARTLCERPVLVSWLYTSTRYAAAKMRRARARRIKNELAAASMNAIENGAEPQKDWEAIRPLIDELVCHLGEKERSVVLLRYFEGRAFSEIGASCGLSPDAARVKVDRALEKLRRGLARRGVTSTAVALGAALTWQASAQVAPELAATIADAAATSTSLTAAGSAFTFMATNKALVIASSLAVLSLGTAFYDVKSQQAGAQALQSSERALADAQSRLAASAEELRSVERETAELKKTLEAKKDVAQSLATNGATGVTSLPSTPADLVKQGDAFLATHPEVKKALVNRGRARIDARYYLLYADLHLTPEQIQRFQNLMLEREAITINYPQTGMITLSAGTGMSKDDVENGLRDLLGGDGYSHYTQMSQSIGAQHLTLSLASALYSTPEPLTPAQAERMIALFSASTQSPSEGAGKPDWAVIVQSASQFLSPAQLTALEAVRAQEKLAVEMRRLAPNP